MNNRSPPEKQTLKNERREILQQLEDWLEALYAFAVFGYLTAAIATFFIGRDAENDEAELAGNQSIKALHAEIAALRADIRALSCQNPEP